MKDPTYHNLGDHTESIQIDYDPAKITYAKLVDVFCSTHNPCRRAWSRQYMSIIFWHDEEQKKIAQEKLSKLGKENGQVYTELVPYKEFYLAEDYHQKYVLQQDDVLMAEFKRMFPNHNDFVNSAAVTKVNGYLGGNGTASEAKSQLEKLGLTKSGGEHLLKSIRQD